MDRRQLKRFMITDGVCFVCWAYLFIDSIVGNRGSVRSTVFGICDLMWLISFVWCLIKYRKNED